MRGFASDVNTTLKTFRINLLTVNYAAAEVGQLTAGNPSAGQYVEVKGALNGSTLNATLVRPEDILGVSDADNVQIAGIVTAFTSLESFDLNGIAVRTDVATEYKSILPEDIGLGSRLTIRGALTNRVLLADEVKSSTQAVLEGNVAGTAAEHDHLVRFWDVDHRRDQRFDPVSGRCRLGIRNRCWAITEGVRKVLRLRVVDGRQDNREPEPEQQGLAARPRG